VVDAEPRRRSSHPQKAFPFAWKVSQVLGRTNARKINISVTLDPDLLGAIERLARKERVTVSAVLREMLRAEMKRRRAMRGGRSGRRGSRSLHVQEGNV
jgi:post-segregation antitoxin (ccd killing protein)